MTARHCIVLTDADARDKAREMVGIMPRGSRVVFLPPDGEGSSPATLGGAPEKLEPRGALTAHWPIFRSGGLSFQEFRPLLGASLNPARRPDAHGAEVTRDASPSPARGNTLIGRGDIGESGAAGPPNRVGCQREVFFLQESPEPATWGFFAQIRDFRNQAAATIRFKRAGVLCALMLSTLPSCQCLGGNRGNRRCWQ